MLTPAKRIIVLICGILATVFVLITVLNPFFTWDNFIYFGIIAAIIISMLACTGENSARMPSRRNLKLKWRGVKSVQFCGACGGRLPAKIKAGMRCNRCGVYLGGDRLPVDSIPAIVPHDAPSPSPSLSREKDRRPIHGRHGKSRIDEFEQEYKGPTGYESSVFTAGDTGILEGDSLVPENERHRNGRFDGNPEFIAFNPPFDGLFKDQSAIAGLFSHFLNWATIGAALRRWVKSVQESPENHAISDAAPTTGTARLRGESEVDAIAKLEAWKVFERGGFTEPTKLPALYQKFVKQQEDADTTAMKTAP